MKTIKFILTTFFVLLVTGVCAYFIMPVINKINFGLDLQGGFEVLYEVSPLKEEDKLTGYIYYSDIYERAEINQFEMEIKRINSKEENHFNSKVYLAIYTLLFFHLVI